MSCNPNPFDRQNREQVPIHDVSWGEAGAEGHIALACGTGNITARLHENRKLDVTNEHISRAKHLNPAVSISKTYIHIQPPHVSIAYRPWNPSWRSSR